MSGLHGLLVGGGRLLRQDSPNLSSQTELKRRPDNRWYVTNYLRVATPAKVVGEPGAGWHLEGSINIDARDLL